MDFVGLPVYSWGAAIGHALRMAARITGRDEVVLAGPMDPEKLAVIRTYCGPEGMARSIAVRELSFDAATGRVDLTRLAAVVGDRTAAVYFENPNFLGVLESEAGADRGPGASGGSGDHRRSRPPLPGAGGPAAPLRRRHRRGHHPAAGRPPQRRRRRRRIHRHP